MVASAGHPKHHEPFIMPRLSRRALLIGSASFAASSGIAAPLTSGYADVVVVGAGAAGIAAARRIAAGGRRCVVVEAADRIGGRCITDTRIFGVPFDRGAHWIHMPDINPVAKLAASAKVEVYPAPAGQRLRIGRRFAREGEMERFLGALVKTNRAIGEAAARAKNDVPCAQVLPKDLGDLRPAVEFVLGPFGCAKDLADVSAADFAKSAERDIDSFCRQGFGTLLVQTSTPVTAIHATARNPLEVETTKGRIGASAVIVTVSTGVLAAGKIKFNPPLPRRHLDAVAKLPLGSYDHIVLELAGNPLGLQSDDLMFEMATSNRTAALLANVSGSALCMVEVGGRFGAGLAAQGEAAMVDFATNWLGELYGADIKKAVQRQHATNWAKEPWALGAFSAAQVGGQPSRRILMEPIGNRIYFAGEAVHESLWGTVGGAWESGERAADAVLKRFAPAAPAKGRGRGQRRA
jgi:monoamine oxidase